MIMTLVLLIMLSVAALGYPHYIASAKKLIGAKQIGSPNTTSCDGNVCQMQVCINNKCHESTTPSQGSNSTIPRTDDDQ
jgi:hypothetical protein